MKLSLLSSKNKLPPPKEDHAALNTKPYPKLIIKFISFILSSPKLIISIPALLIFILAYNVLYDFTVKFLNGQVISHFHDFSIHPDFDDQIYNHHIKINSLLDSLTQINNDHSKNISITKIVLTSNDLKNVNVLKFDFLNQANNLINQISSDSNPNQSMVISPFSLLPLDFNVLSQNNLTSTSINTNNVQKYISKYINFDINTQFINLFLDNLFKYNHLIQKAQLLKFYVIHESNFPIINQIDSFSSNHSSSNPLIKITDISTVDSSSSVQDFIRYFLIQASSYTSANLFIGSINFIESILLIIFLIYMYLSIANQHKIRSTLGLLCGWLIETLLSATASINIISYLHNYKSWKLIFEPLTLFTKIGYILSIMILSSRNLFRLINDLAGDNTFEINNDIHKRLFKFFLGINISVRNSNTKLKVLDSMFKYIGFDLHNSYIPNITKILIINIVGLCCLNALSVSLFKFYFDGKFMEYLSMRLYRFIEATILALVIDHFLQLTYLVGIIIIDLNRYELMDLLNRTNDSSESSINSIDSSSSIDKSILYEVNSMSSFLLGLKYDQSNRPLNSSIRYRLGQYLLKIRPANLITFWFILLPFIQLIQLLGIFTNWSLLMPYNLINNESNTIIKINSRNIIVNKNECIYYLELFSIVLFILAISQIVFKLNKFKNPDKIQIQIQIQQNQKLINEKKLSTADFEINDEIKYFKIINLDVPQNKGHDLDVFKIITNPTSSFVVSIGLDHKILVWSPLNKPSIPPPINLSENLTKFWPVNLIKISNDGKFIILMNFKLGLVKCYERESLNYNWSYSIPVEILNKFKNGKIKILESFFRKRTVPGFLTRKILQKKKSLQKQSKSRSRRGSDASMMSIPANLNSNFPPPLMSQPKNEIVDDELIELKKSLDKEDFIIILETGELIIFSCNDGTVQISNIIESSYDFDDDNDDTTKTNLDEIKLNAAKKITTSRVSDRIICNVNNDDLIVATVVNNKWKFRKMLIQEGTYNTGTKLLTPQTLVSSISDERHNFTSTYKSTTSNQNQIESISQPTKRYKLINKSVIVPIEFVGMMLRVKDLTAQLIDVQTGMILKIFNIGHFKIGSLKVSHSEPTHCKFCGCVSVKSFSIIYEDFYESTIIMQTYQLESKKSKNNICLRVERDPREIRCLGFNAVIEKQYWFEDIEKWELTDINIIIGFKKREQLNDSSSNEDEEEIEQLLNENNDESLTSGRSNFQSSGLKSLRTRKSNRKLFSKSYGSIAKNQSKQKQITLNDVWECFIISATDGVLIDYNIPPSIINNKNELITNKINSISKYGYKSVIVNFGSFIKIFYLGNDKLIEDGYYSDSATNITTSSNVSKSSDNTTNSVDNLPSSNTNELAFINKRRMREKHKAKPSTINQ